MKKLFASMTAIALVGAMMVPLAAFAETGQTNVIMDGTASTSYTIRIPANITIRDNGTYVTDSESAETIKLTAYSSDPLLSEYVVVSIDDEEDFQLTSAGRENVAYTLQRAVEDLETGDYVATGDALTGGDIICALTNTTDEAYLAFTVAGSHFGNYTGTLNFNVGLGTT